VRWLFFGLACLISYSARGECFSVWNVERPSYREIEIHPPRGIEPINIRNIAADNHRGPFSQNFGLLFWPVGFVKSCHFRKFASSPQYGLGRLSTTGGRDHRSYGEWGDNKRGSNNGVVGWSLARIFDRNFDGWRAVLPNNLGETIHNKVGPQLPAGIGLFLLNSFDRIGVSLESGFGSSSSFINHVLGVISGTAGMVQRSDKQSYAYQSNSSSNSSCPKHHFCPKSHIHLSLQIGFLAGLVPFVLGLIFWGYRLADRGLDLLERGRKFFGFGLLLGTVIATPTLAIVLLSSGYWLAFENGFLLLLR